MYHPLENRAGTNSLEFIELWNSGLITEDLTGHRLTGEVDYTFPPGTTIEPGQFLAIARDPAGAGSFYGVSFLGPYEGKLADNGGVLRLRNELGGVLLEVKYDNKPPWPAAADGAGHSLVLDHPSYGERDSRAWSASDAIDGTPGTFEHHGAEPARGVVINELLAHTDLPQEDAIELYNTGGTGVDLSGAWLSDEAGTNKFQLPPGTTIAGHGFLSFTETALGFGLSAEGESVFLVSSNRTRVLDAVTFDGQENGISVGRHPDGAPGWQRLASVTLGSTNAAPLASPVVINEIMYHPISEDDNDEYVELFNRSGAAVDVGGWRLQDGVSYTFPSNTIIPAGGYAVVAANATNLLARYPQLSANNTYGNFGGTLADGGERIVLSKADDIVNIGAAGTTTNIFYIPVNEVTYADGGRWDRWSDGGGSSLELIDPDADARLAPNWADSDESAKASWTSIDATNVMENGQTGLVDEGATGNGAANRFELFLQGAGEALLDNVEFRSNGRTNLVGNGDFENGTSNWYRAGVLRRSYAESGVGIGGSAALHLVSAGRGDTGPNKIARALYGTAATGSTNTGTMRAQARWLKGSPWILLRMRGNWMEVSRRLLVPSNLGTPGQPNSRLVANAPPAITDVSHAPILPATGQAVTVSARVSDPDGVALVQLKYRVDPALSYTAVAMTNDHGLYLATLPGQTTGKLVAFTIEATDGLAATGVFPSDAPARECLVRWGESAVAGSIGTYRLWMTATNVAFWTSRERNANDPLDATFVYGNSRAFYNVDTMYSGSPFHTPAYNGPLNAIACDYEVNFQPDDRFLGSEPFVLSAYDVTSGNFFFNDDSAQVDLTGNWIARKLGQPCNYRRHINLFFNGVKRGTIYDDAQQPNGETLDEYFPNSDVELRKIESWFEFADDAQSQGSVYATLERVLASGGGIDTKRYRWNWRPRATENPDNWDAFTNLIAAVNDASNGLARLKQWMDVPNFLRPVIAHHICGSWDSYAYERGKNMFAAHPDGAGWRLLMWDIEIALGAGGESATDSIYNMFDETLLSLIVNNPEIQREYLRGFQEAVDTSLVAGAADKALDERYAAFQQHGIPLVSPAFIKTYIASRRAYLQSVLPQIPFGVAGPVYQVVSNANTLVLSGTAPLAVTDILVNSNAYPVTWTSLSNWVVTVALSGGTNVLNISARDRRGDAVSNAAGSVTAYFDGITVAPEDSVLFNEIMYRPASAGAEFVELFNANTNQTFDLTGWSVNGLGYDFPSGTLLPPGGYLVLAADASAYAQAYGLTNPPFGTYPGKLDPDGETLSLLRPGPDTNALAVDRVRYETTAPWMTATNGVSLQLIDAGQDNSRVANWAAVSPGYGLPPASLALLTYGQVWRYNQSNNLDAINWISPTFNDASWPAGPGLLAFESNGAITNLIGTVLNDPRVSTGEVAAGHACYFRTTFVLYQDPNDYRFTVGARVDDGAIFYLNGVDVKRLRVNAAGSITNGAMATGQPPGSDATADDVFELPASAFIQGTNVLAVSVHQNGATSSDIVFGMQLNAAYTNTTVVIRASSTPAAGNSVITNLPAFPPLWLNELQPNNVTGPLDNFGQHDPWLECVNTGSSNVSLAGCYLTDTYTNLAKWAFGPGDVASNGFTLIWCDNATNQRTAAVMHAGLVPVPGGGSLAITRLVNGVPQVLDYLNYANLPANWSYGSVPDAQPFYRRAIFGTTPGVTNSGANAPISVSINEWMADNSATLADPADGQFEDWFELYNFGSAAVDLGGYYLTDNLGDKFQYQIPNNGRYLIPAGGYLLVWADNEAGQNSTNRADLHAGFSLAKGGEAIGLFSADGSTIDAVTFDAQVTDVSQGRFTDGTPNVIFMTIPTPRAANRLPNTAPVLASPSNRVITLGQTLRFTAAAYDTNQPPQILTFSLTNAPAGAAIGAGSGLFTWTPSLAPTSAAATIIVTDNGVPPLADSKSFSITVAPVPDATGFRMDPGLFAFDWVGVSGQLFQVQSAGSLVAPIWIPVSANVAGNGGTLSFTNILEDEGERYFRLLVLP